MVRRQRDDAGLGAPADEPRDVVEQGQEGRPGRAAAGRQVRQLDVESQVPRQAQARSGSRRDEGAVAEPAAHQTVHAAAGLRHGRLRRGRTRRRQDRNERRYTEHVPGHLHRFLDWSLPGTTCRTLLDVPVARPARSTPARLRRTRSSSILAGSAWQDDPISPDRETTRFRCGGARHPAPGVPSRRRAALSSHRWRRNRRGGAAPATAAGWPCSSSCPAVSAWSTRCSGSRSWACCSGAPPTLLQRRSRSSFSVWRSAAPSSGAGRRACARRCAPMPGSSSGSRRRPDSTSCCSRSTSSSTRRSTTRSQAGPRRSTRPGSRWRRCCCCPRRP